SSFVVTGGTLTLPGIASFTAPSSIGDWHWYATGSGSKLNFPNLTTIGTLTNSWLLIDAKQGGEIDLPLLATVTNTRPVSFLADGAGSKIDLSSLATFNGFAGYAALIDTNGATVVAPILTSMVGIQVTVDGSGTIATSQWQSFDTVTLNVSG